MWRRGDEIGRRQSGRRRPEGRRSDEGSGALGGGGEAERREARGGPWGSAGVRRERTEGLTLDRRSGAERPGGRGRAHRAPGRPPHISPSASPAVMAFRIGMRKDTMIAGKYRIVRKVGSGSFGDIYLGINITNGEVRPRYTCPHVRARPPYDSPLSLSPRVFVPRASLSPVPCRIPFRVLSTFFRDERVPRSASAFRNAATWTSASISQSRLFRTSDSTATFSTSPI